MQAIRSTDTAPEKAVRSRLHQAGLRYRVGIAPEPGIRRRADIVFTKARVAVFIDGCFWHGCAEHGRQSFKHNTEYWSQKIAGNVARDRETSALLEAYGWKVLRFWEHEDPDEVSAVIARAVKDPASPTTSPRLATTS